MAASRVTDELTALEQSRSRLEAALSRDEHWRALKQASGHDEAEESAARRARNTRLKMALAENPLFQAWKHLNEAIDALRESGADADGATEPVASAAHAGQSISASGELPEEIANILHGDASSQDMAQGRANTLASRPEASSLLEDARDADDELPRTQEHAAPLTGDGLQSTSPPLPRAAVAASDAGADGDPAPQPQPRDRAAPDPEEATVMFVRREPLLPSAALPADLGTERSSALFERLRGLSMEPEPAEETFATPSRGTEEAEVTIVTAESARDRREVEERAGTIRRLRKTLSGD